MNTLKHKGKGPQALTANELREGYSVWLSKDFTWSRDFKDALITEDQSQIDAMQEQGTKDDKANLVVGVYFIDIDPESRLPVRYRETFRMNGPSWDTAADVIAKQLSSKPTIAAKKD